MRMGAIRSQVSFLKTFVSLRFSVLLRPTLLSHPLLTRWDVNAFAIVVLSLPERETGPESQVLII